MSSVVKRRKSDPDRNGNEQSIHMSGTAPEHDVYKSEKRGFCGRCCSFLFSMIKILIFVGVVGGLLSIIVTLRNRNEMLSLEVQRLTSESQANEQKYITFQKDAEQLQVVKREMASSTDQLKADLIAKQQALDKALDDYGVVSSQNQANIEKLNQAISRQQQIDQEKSQVINQLNGDLENLRNKNQELATALDNERNNAGQQTQNIAAERDTVQAKLNEVQGSLNAFSNENAQLKQQIAELNNAKNALNTDKQNLAADVQAKDASIQQLQQNIATLQAEKQELLAKVPVPKN